MRLNQFMLLAALLVLAACTPQQVINDEHHHGEQDYERMRECAEQPRGEDCGYYLEHAEHHDIKSEGMHGEDMPMMGSNGQMPRAQGALLPRSADAQTPPAKSSTIIDVTDGQRIDLSADIVTKTIDGKQVTMYGYNGQIPGPVLRAEQGTRITVDFTNNIDHETTVHWHGLRHDNKDDGVPGVTQEAVAPGATFTYELYFPDEGIYWYHPHVREDVQQDAGLAGNMLVRPEEDYNPANQEELLVLDDILMHEDGIVPYGKEHANFALMGRYGNVMLVNGETDHRINVQSASVVRLYLTNVANARPFNISIPGAEMKLVGGDMGQYEEETFVESITIAPAQRAIIDVRIEEPGTYEIINKNPHATYTLASIIASEEQASEDYSESFYEDLVNEAVKEDIAAYQAHFERSPDYELTLDVEMAGMMQDMPCHAMGGMVMGDCTQEEREELLGHGLEPIEWEDEMQMPMNTAMTEWIIRDADGNENMDITIESEIGDLVKIRITNDATSMHPMQHPIHLHGQRFLVTHRNGQATENKVWMDTVLVPAGETVEILVDVTNPGEWMLHCHIAEHLEAGMMASFRVA